MSGAWGAWARGWRVFLPVAVGLAAIQAVTVIGDPQPMPDAVFALLVAASLVATIAAVALVAEAALASVDRRRPHVPDTALVLWSAGVTVGVALVAVLLYPLAPIAIAVALVLLPAAADGRRNALRGFVVFARHPVRASVHAVVAVLVVALAWIVAFLLGFFVTGPLAAFATWLVFGLVGTLLACSASALYRRAAPRD